MESTAHSSMVALLVLLAIQCVYQVNAGTCTIYQKCGFHMDCKENYSCAKPIGHAEDLTNCRCYANPPENDKSGNAAMKEVLEQCYKPDLSPKECAYRGSCGKGDQCMLHARSLEGGAASMRGLMRDCELGTMCFKNKNAAKNDYKGLCLDPFSEQGKASSFVEAKGSRPNMACHGGFNLWGIWGHIAGY